MVKLVGNGQGLFTWHRPRPLGQRATSSSILPPAPTLLSTMWKPSQQGRARGSPVSVGCLHSVGCLRSPSPATDACLRRPQRRMPAFALLKIAAVIKLGYGPANVCKKSGHDSVRGSPISRCCTNLRKIKLYLSN